MAAPPWAPPECRLLPRRRLLFPMVAAPSMLAACYLTAASYLPHATEPIAGQLPQAAMLELLPSIRLSAARAHHRRPSPSLPLPDLCRRSPVTRARPSFDLDRCTPMACHHLLHHRSLLSDPTTRAPPQASHAHPLFVAPPSHPLLVAINAAPSSSHRTVHRPLPPISAHVIIFPISIVVPPCPEQLLPLAPTSSITATLKLSTVLPKPPIHPGLLPFSPWMPPPWQA